MTAGLLCQAAVILLLDASASVREPEWDLQRRGHAEALAGEGFVRVVEAGGPVAVLPIGFTEWPERMEGGWRVVATAADARALAGDIAEAKRPGGMGTRIARALSAAIDAFSQAPCDADQRVVDLVTDGQTIDAPDVDRQRDRAQAMGVRVNALGVGTNRAMDWLREHAVTPGGFAMEAEDWGDFADAVRRKLVREVAERGERE